MKESLEELVKDSKISYYYDTILLYKFGDKFYVEVREPYQPIFDKTTLIEDIFADIELVEVDGEDYSDSLEKEFDTSEEAIDIYLKIYNYIKEQIDEKKA